MIKYGIFGFLFNVTVYYILPLVLGFFLPFFIIPVVILAHTPIRMWFFNLFAESGDKDGASFSVANMACPRDSPSMLDSAINTLTDPSNGEAAMAIKANIDNLNNVNNLATCDPVDLMPYNQDLAELMTSISAVTYEFSGKENNAKIVQEMPKCRELDQGDKTKISTGVAVDGKFKAFGFGDDMKAQLSFQLPGRMQETFCMLFYSKKLNMITVAFQGTSPFSYAMILTDITVAPEKVNYETNAMIHAGFMAALYDKVAKVPGKESMDAFQIIGSQINALLSKVTTDAGRPAPSLWVTGHSLGAAIATVFMYRAMQLRETPTNPVEEPWSKFRFIGSYNIGSPRVGNQQFAEEFMDLANNKAVLWRIRNANDAVTRVPPAGLYCHVGNRVDLHYNQPNC
ncbi:unnamed protein product, partial [Chrysoparadoxa australica]